MGNLKMVAISAGHGKTVYGKYDPGTTGVYAGEKVTERQFTVDIASRVLRILKDKLSSYDVLVQGVGIETEASVVKKYRFINSMIDINGFNPADCYAVSIHVDSNVDVAGICGYYQTWRYNRGLELLNSILAGMCKYFQNTFVKKGWPRKSITSRFKGLYIDGSRCAHVLVEMGHIGNRNSVFNMIHDPDRMAESIAHGIMEFLRSKYPIA